MSIMDKVKRAASNCPCAKRARALMEKRRIAREQAEKDSK